MPRKLGDHEVGYCRPPKKNQQKPGEPSINPDGRRGKKREPGLGASSPPPGPRDELADAFIEEALMPLNDPRRKKPPKDGLHAFARSMMNEGVKAISAAAQGNYFDALKWSFGQKAIALEAWGKELMAIQSTIDPDEIWPMKPTVMLPNAKDVVANRATGEYAIEGPINEQQYALEQRALERRDEAAAALDLAYSKVREAQSPEERDLHWEEVERARADHLHFNAMLGRGHRILPERLLDWYPDKERYEARLRMMEEYGDEF